MNQIMLVASIFFTALALLLSREYSWQNYAVKQTASIQQLKEELQSINADIQLQCKLTCLSLSDNEEGSLSDTKRQATTSTASTSTLQVKPTPRLYDRSGLFKLGCFIVFMSYEMRYIHKSYLQKLQTDVTQISQKTFHDFNIFLNRRLTLCNLVFFSILFIVSFIAWLGWFRIDRKDWNQSNTKLILLWTTAYPMALFINNLVHLYPYLPPFHLRDILDRSSSDGSPWKSLDHWAWIAMKLIGFGEPLEFVQITITLVLLWLSIWPLRYCFYYSYTDKESFHLGNSFDVFLSNMLMQTSFSLVYYNTLCQLLFRSPIFTAVDSAEMPSMLHRFILNPTYRLLHSLVFARLDSSVAVAATTFVFGLSVVILALRVLWFIFITGGCVTWYCLFILLLFFLLPISLVIGGLPLLNTLIYRFETVKVKRKVFLDTFVAKFSTFEATSGEVDNKEEDYWRAVGGTFFAEVLDKTSIVYFFNESLHQATQDRKSDNSSASTSEDDHAADQSQKSNYQNVFDSLMLATAADIPTAPANDESSTDDSHVKESKAAYDDDEAQQDDSVEASCID